MFSFYVNRIEILFSVSRFDIVKDVTGFHGWEKREVKMKNDGSRPRVSILCEFCLVGL